MPSIESDFSLLGGVDFNLLYCYEIPRRDFVAVGKKLRMRLTKSGVEEPGRAVQKWPKRSRTGLQAGKANPGKGNRRRTAIKTGEGGRKSGAWAR
jgi:hypothetical protein